ncbi:MAG: hypothetical protein AAF328_00295 [Planctomycetota bacterium]
MSLSAPVNPTSSRLPQSSGDAERHALNDTSTLPAVWSGPAKRRVTCPHCWTRFHLGDTLWIARHASLRGDPVAGDDAMRRFLPTRFDVKGRAIDAGGEACHDLACPTCRLPIARALLEASQLFLSLVGVPASGKSYLTAAMSWRLRTVLPQLLGWSFRDVDASNNATLIADEQTLFLQERGDIPVSIEKTQLQGAHYDAVRFGERQVQLARPFQFVMRDQRGGVCPSPPRTLNLYDNAGEHFLPGQDSALSPGTQHVARANAVMFLFDPLQDPRCRAAITEHERDPQFDQAHAASTGIRQDTVLNEMAARVRRYAGLDDTSQLDTPLMVLVGKADTWLDHAGLSWGQDPEPVVPLEGGRYAVDTALIERVSDAVRRWLMSTTPEFVSLAEASHRVVRYLPVSALGGPPVRQADGGLAVVPDRLAPRWVAAPVLYAMSKWATDLLPAAVEVRPQGEQGGTG